MVEFLRLTANGTLRVTDLLEQADWRIHTPRDSQQRSREFQFQAAYNGPRRPA